MGVTVPAPAPEPAPTDATGSALAQAAQALSSLGIDPTGTSGSTSAYAKVKLDISGLFDNTPNNVVDGQTAIDLFVKASHDPSLQGQYVAIQDALLKGGFYGSDAPAYGVFTPADLTAFRSFVAFGGDKYASGVDAKIVGAGQTPYAFTAVGMMNAQASAGEEFGAATARRQRSLQNIRLVNPADAAEALDRAYTSQLGRKATAAEKAAFTAAYHAQEVGADRAVLDAQANLLTSQSTAAGYGAIPGLPGAGQVTPVGPTPPDATTAMQLAARTAAGTAAYDKNGTAFSTNLFDAGQSSTPNAAPDLLGAIKAFGSPPPTDQAVTAYNAATAQQSALSAQSGAQQSDLDNFLHALGVQESGGSYGSVNATSGASGKYQIMPANWPSWAQQAGLSPNAPQSPQNQELVVRYKISQYYNQFHNWGAVAAAWYGGPTAGAAYAKDPATPWLQRPQGQYPSIASYASSVLGKAGQPSAGIDFNYNPVSGGPGIGSTAATLPGEAGNPLTTVDAASLTAAADKQAQTANPAEFGAHEVASTFDNFLSLLKGIV